MDSNFVNNMEFRAQKYTAIDIKRKQFEQHYSIAI